MKKVTITVEITIDEDNIRDRYPNFKFNWDTTDEFIEHLINHIESDEEINGLPVNSLNVYGYKIDVLTRDEMKLRELEKDEK